MVEVENGRAALRHAWADVRNPYITFEKSYSAPDLPMVVVGKRMGGLALCMDGSEESYIAFEKSYIAPDLPMVVVGKCMGGLALCMGGSNSKGEGELLLPSLAIY